MTEKEAEKPQSRFLKISARKQAAPLARYSMVDLKFTLETAISDVLTEKITIKLSTSKYSDKVVIKAIKEVNGKKTFSELDNSVGKWFTELGHFAPEHFLEDFSRLLSGKTKKNQ
ncbi:hypothetical protein HDV02_001132 [Globomyces sp. JEL0801]|nr:hypothetical protein HDV02_001132 [Globomyces sp. JEL0801]